jgi:hypothetical protein
MDKGRIQQVVDSMDPVQAAEEMAVAAKKLFSILGEDALRDFLTNLLADGGQDKITGLVHL